MTWNNDMSAAPRDGRYILAVVADGIDGRFANYAGRMFVIRHEGYTGSGYDLGWAAYPGYGGTPDEYYAKWQLTPPQEPDNAE